MLLHIDTLSWEEYKDLLLNLLHFTLTVMLKFHHNQLQNWCYKENSFEISFSQFKFSNSDNLVG